MFALGALAPSVASAAEAKLLWKVGGKLLEAHATKEITTKATKTYALTGNFAGAKITIECEAQQVKAGTQIEGGDGAGETGDASGTLEFSSCRVKEFPKCRVKEPIAARFESELAEDSGKTGKVDLLFQPAEDGTTFTEVSVENNKEEVCLLKGKFPVGGTVAAEIAPAAGEEATTGHLILPAKAITEVVELSEGKRTTIKVGLTLGGKEASLSGESEVKLISKEVFGVV